MKSFLIKFVIILIIGSAAAMGYVLYKNGFINIPSGGDEDQVAMTDEEREKNLEWLNSIRGYDENADEEENGEDAEDEEATSTEDGLDDEMDTEDSDDAMTEDEAEEVDTEEDTDAAGSDESLYERGIENLGKADALESTVYDHAFDKLVLFAELRTDSVALEWNATESEQFKAYKIVRSLTDENPYYPKTNAIKTISNRDSTSYTDTNLEPGTTYYYRVCFEKTDGLPGCGNILRVTL